MLSPKAIVYYLVFILIFFSVIIEHNFAISGLYKFIAFFSIVVGLPYTRMRSGIFIQLGATIIVVLLFLTLLSDQNPSNSIRSFMSFVWPVFFAMSMPKGVTKNGIIGIQILLCTGVAFGGIYEFFFSRDLHGLVPRVGYEELYENMDLAYRTRSFVYSVQVNSLVLVVGLILSLEFGRKIFGKGLYYLMNAVLFFAGTLTFSQMFFVILLLYIFIKVDRVRRTFFSVFVLIFLGILLLVDVDYLQYERVVSFASSANIERLNKQLNVFGDFRILTGRGVGVTEASNPNYINPESYYLKLLLEFGLPATMLILSYIILRARSLKSSIKRVIYPLLCSGIFAHTLAAPQFVVVYCLLFSQYENTDKFFDV